MLAKEHSGVYLYRVPTVGRSPPWDFGSAQAPIPLCSAACFRSLLAPSHLPRRRLAVLGWHDSRRRRRTNRRSGAARPTASSLPGRAIVPTFPDCSGLRRAAPTKPTRFILRYVLNTHQPLLITHFLIDSLLIRQDCH